MANKKNSMKGKTHAELVKLVADTRAELRAHRLEAAGARAKNPNAFREGRKTIARVLTEQNARVRASKLTK